MMITDVKCTQLTVPVAAMVNTNGVHQDVVLRAIVEFATDTGLPDLQKDYGALHKLTGVQIVAAAPDRQDAFDLTVLNSHIGFSLPECGVVRKKDAFRISDRAGMNRPFGRETADKLHEAVTKP